MEFNEAVEKISKGILKGLPGLAAHEIMLPSERKIDTLTYNTKDVKLSGVLIILFNKNGQTYSVLIERNIYNGIHSGQISLPGGKMEMEDNNLIETAIRESKEEIGVSINNNNVIGCLSELYIPPSNFLVLPVLGYLDTEPNFKIDVKEVKSLIIYDIEELINIKKLNSKLFFGKDYQITAPYFNIHGHSVWGATAMILSELRALLLSK